MTAFRRLTEKQLAVLRYGAFRTLEPGRRVVSGQLRSGRFEEWRLRDGAEQPIVSAQVYALLRRRLIRIDPDTGEALPLFVPLRVRRFIPPGKWKAFPRGE